MTTKKRLCGAPDARSVLVCDRPTKHTGQHAATVDGERFYWGRASGPSGGASAARASTSGLLRVEAYLNEEASAALVRFRTKLGSNRAALEWALTHAPPPAA
jgi:hypothetical protein